MKIQLFTTSFRGNKRTVLSSPTLEPSVPLVTIDGFFHPCSRIWCNLCRLYVPCSYLKGMEAPNHAISLILFGSKYNNANRYLLPFQLLKPYPLLTAWRALKAAKLIVAIQIIIMTIKAFQISLPPQPLIMTARMPSKT